LCVGWTNGGVLSEVEGSFVLELFVTFSFQKKAKKKHFFIKYQKLKLPPITRYLYITPFIVYGNNKKKY
jgi:hypothetical protein